MRNAPILLALPLLAGGCLHTVGTVVTAPVRVTSKVVDWTTTSQSEADRNRGRKMRKQEERDARERRKADAACRKDASRCAPYEANRPAD
jgi:hypothetical protein